MAQSAYVWLVGVCWASFIRGRRIGALDQSYGPLMLTLHELALCRQQNCSPWFFIVLVAAAHQGTLKPLLKGFYRGHLSL